MKNIYIYIMIMFLVTLMTRYVPLFLFRKKIKNTFFNSFLFYVPYVTLSVMTFPAIVKAPELKIAGLISFIVGIVTSYFKDNLIIVSFSTCLTVFIIEKFLI